MTQTFNMDCYDYMKALPDNAFDLLIADPPYGDCDGSWGGERIDSRTTRGGSQDTGEAEVRSKVRQIQRPSRKSLWGGGSSHIGKVPGRHMGSKIQQAWGSRGSDAAGGKERRHILGRGSKRRGLRRDVPCVEEPDNLGWQLLSSSANKVFRGMGQAVHLGYIQHGHVRVCVDELQGDECEKMGRCSTRYAGMAEVPSNTEAHRSLSIPPASFRKAGGQDPGPFPWKRKLPHSGMGGGLRFRWHREGRSVFQTAGETLRGMDQARSA